MEGFEYVCLKGNHEDMMKQAAFGDSQIWNWWLNNGGNSTVSSYNKKPFDMMFDKEVWVSTISKHLHWINSLPLTHRDGNYFFVHAGVDPNQPIDGQNEQIFLWIRDKFLVSEGPYYMEEDNEDPVKIVHGHTPRFNGYPDIFENSINIDTGVFKTKVLTAVALSETDVGESIEIIQSDRLPHYINLD